MKNHIRFSSVGVLAVMMAFLGNAFAADVFVPSAASVQAAAKKAGWIAGETSVSRLPREQIRRMLGVQNPPDMMGQFAVREDAKLFAQKPKTAIDWRNKNGVNYVSPIMNQGNCGSCVAFATAATLETQVNVTSGIPNLNPSFSKQALFVCGGGACEFGWQPELAAKYLQNTGVPDEACAPYTMGATGETVECSSVCSDSASRSLKIVKYTRPTNGSKNVEAVKAALAKGPLITTLMVMSDFVNYKSGVYKTTSKDALGGHAVSIVGYDDTARAWVIRNSWGEDWGENGFARISWDDTSGVGDETWLLNVPTQDGYVTVHSPESRQILEGTNTMDAESTYPHTAKIDLAIADQQGRAIQSPSCEGARCKTAINSADLADGAYDVMATAHWSGGDAKSQHEQFYVLNHKPQLSITYQGDADSDLSKPLKDRIVFAVNADSGPVPFSSLTFHAKKDGQEVYTKSADIVLSKMTFGWRTPTVENGKYEIYFTGKLTTTQHSYTAESEHMTVEVKN